MTAAKDGKIGELLVELKLTELDWHVMRLDDRRYAPNADLLAMRGNQRVSVQVKATGPSHSHATGIHLGNAKAYLANQAPFFNSKASPIRTDVVIAVNRREAVPRYVVLPVAVAEFLCRSHADYWSNVAKRNGDRRSGSFPIYIELLKSSDAHASHHVHLRQIAQSFEGRWEVLESETDTLHDLSIWIL